VRVNIRQAVLKKVVPDVHLLAPNLNSSFIRQTVHRAVHGVGPLPPAAAAAEKQLAEQDGVVKHAIGELIENHASLAAAQGFVTNLGGLVTMAAAVPVNITGLALLQVRLVAGIAHLRGYDLSDDRVRNAILLCTLGEQSVKSLVKGKKVPGTPMVLATAPAYDPELDKLVAAEVTSALVGRVVGKKAAGTMVRRVPVAGGVWAAGTDAYATWQIGKYAERELRPRTEAAAVGTGRSSRR
jgi:EcsC protein family